MATPYPGASAAIRDNESRADLSVTGVFFLGMTLCIFLSNIFSCSVACDTQGSESKRPIPARDSIMSRTAAAVLTLIYAGLQLKLLTSENISESQCGEIAGIQDILFAMINVLLALSVAQHWRRWESTPWALRCIVELTAATALVIAGGLAPFTTKVIFVQDSAAGGRSVCGGERHWAWLVHGTVLLIFLELVIETSLCAVQRMREARRARDLAAQARPSGRGGATYQQRPLPLTMRSSSRHAYAVVAYIAICGVAALALSKIRAERMTSGTYKAGVYVTLAQLVCITLACHFIVDHTPEIPACYAFIDIGVDRPRRGSATSAASTVSSYSSASRGRGREASSAAASAAAAAAEDVDPEAADGDRRAFML